MSKTKKIADPTTQYKQMCDEIRRHDRLYYVEGAPEIKDAEYDKLFQELLAFEKSNANLGRALNDSPTQRVGGDVVSELKSVTHGTFMLSIDNAFTSEALSARWNKWVAETKDKKPAVCVEPKVDGAAVSLLYTNGKLTGALTRGDGTQGDDILHSAKNMRGVPHVLELPGVPDMFHDTFVEVRGEAYITNSDFAKDCAAMAKRGEKPHKHPRNATVGALRSLDPTVTWARHIRFAMHSFGAVSEQLLDDDWPATKQIFRMSGMPILPTIANGKFDEKELQKRVEFAREEIAKGDIPADGVVVKLANFKDRDTVGASSRAVNWAVAVKKELYAATTTVKQLAVQVGKLGTLTPMCFMEPVEIDGTEVSKATLHNFDIVDELDIRVGDEILVEKAGKIIPHVLEVRKGKRKATSQKFLRPTMCPVCKGAVVQDGAALKCTNTLGCPAQLEAVIMAAAARDRLCIDGLGPVLIKQLVKAKLVTCFTDLWLLAKKKEQLAKLPGVGEKTISKLLTELDAAKKRTPDKLLSCLNIPGIGRTKSKFLVSTYGSIDEILDCTFDDLRPFVGPAAGQTCYDWFQVKANAALIAKFKTLGFNFGKATGTPGTPIPDGPLEGMSVCATGSFEKFTRDTIGHAIEVAGGKVASSVSKKTNYLVVGKDAGSKAATAAKLGVKCLTETEFRTLIGAK